MEFPTSQHNPSIPAKRIYINSLFIKMAPTGIIRIVGCRSRQACTAHWYLGSGKEWMARRWTIGAWKEWTWKWMAPKKKTIPCTIKWWKRIAFPLIRMPGIIWLLWKAGTWRWMAPKKKIIPCTIKWWKRTAFRLIRMPAITWLIWKAWTWKAWTTVICKWALCPKKATGLITKSKPLF